MEVVVEADEDLKKWARTKPIRMSTEDIEKKESPEQKESEMRKK